MGGITDIIGGTPTCAGIGIPGEIPDGGGTVTTTVPVDVGVRLPRLLLLLELLEERDGLRLPDRRLDGAMTI